MQLREWNLGEIYKARQVWLGLQAGRRVCIVFHFARHFFNRRRMLTLELRLNAHLERNP